MKIAILGAGNIGGTLGKKWVQAGHDVVFGVRNVDSAKTQAALGKTDNKATAVSVAEAVQFGDIILFSIPWSAVPETAAAHADALNGKILIDATNNFGGPVINRAAELQQHAPQAHIFRAFNSMGWETFDQPRFGENVATLFYCGPDGPVRTQLEMLISEVGLQPAYVGGLELVTAVDAVGTLWVSLALRQGWGRRLAFTTLTEVG